MCVCVSKRDIETSKGSVSNQNVFSQFTKMLFHRNIPTVGEQREQTTVAGGAVRSSEPSEHTACLSGGEMAGSHRLIFTFRNCKI